MTVLQALFSVPFLIGVACVAIFIGEKTLLITGIVIMVLALIIPLV